MARRIELSVSRKRVGIVVAELGIPSEVWTLRQCMEFEGLEPVLLYWRMHEQPSKIPPGLDRRQFQESFAKRPGLRRRLARRLGIASAVLPDAAQREDIRRTVQEAGVEALLCHFASSGLPVSAAMQHELPIAWQVHGRDVSSKMQELAYRRAIANALPELDHLVSVGKFQLDLLRPHGLSARCSVIPCGAPLSSDAERRTVHSPAMIGKSLQ